MQRRTTGLGDLAVLVQAAAVGVDAVALRGAGGGAASARASRASRGAADLATGGLSL